jgi:hypothetical protein
VCPKTDERVKKRKETKKKGVDEIERKRVEGVRLA